MYIVYTYIYLMCMYAFKIFEEVDILGMFLQNSLAQLYIRGHNNSSLVAPWNGFPGYHVK